MTTAQLLERVESRRQMRRALVARGWGDTPSLDEDIAALEAALQEACGACLVPELAAAGDDARAIDVGAAR
jgi:hypothetical protein